MADAKMSWDKTHRQWRKTYKQITLMIKASDLGGKGREDTVVAANQWVDRQISEIDAGIHPKQNIDVLEQKRNNSHQEKYKAELVEIQTTIKTLTRLDRKSPLIETLKAKVTAIQQILKGEDVLPLDLSLKNPLRIERKQLEEEADTKAKEERYRQLLYDYKSRGVLPSDVIESSWMEHQRKIYDANTDGKPELDPETEARLLP